jgi:tetratricopeptide (TPR) repeat protein
MLAFLLVAIVSVTAQTANSNISDANALLRQSKYADAEAAFRAITTAAPESGAAWFGLGQALEANGQPDKAIAAYARALELKFAPTMNMLYTARAYAKQGNQEQAYVWLTKVSESNPPPAAIQIASGSPAFASMKEQPRFKQLLESMKPCSSPEYHQFDFWVGSWAVQNPQGQTLGRNDVTNIQGGCVLQENWVSGRGSETGTSLNFYDSRDKKWHQLYYDNSGNMGAYPPLTGEFKDGKMVMLSDPGQQPMSRWTWYLISPGKARQMSEQSNDNGKTWTTIWDSVYVK